MTWEQDPKQTNSPQPPRPWRAIPGKVHQSPRHQDLHRASEGRHNYDPRHKNGHRQGLGQATPWKGDWRLRQVNPKVPAEQGKIILRDPRKIYLGNKESPQRIGNLREHWWIFWHHPSPPDHQYHRLLVQIQVLPCPGHPHGTTKSQLNVPIEIIIMWWILQNNNQPERLHISLRRVHKEPPIPTWQIPEGRGASGPGQLNVGGDGHR